MLSPQRTLSVSLLLPLVVASVLPRASTCNGHAELCNRSYANVTFVGAHNSYAVGSTNLATNQDYDVKIQLKDGIRLLQNQAHSTDSGEIHLCHTDCLIYDGGPLTTYLGDVKSWMNSNTNDVVTILLVNINNLAASAFGSAFASAGLDTLAYAPSTSTLTTSQWPTLGSLIDSGKRLVVFLDNGAGDPNYPYLLPEFGNVWETAFDVTEPTFSCAVNRSSGDTSQQMSLINHFLDSTQTIIGSASSLAPDKAQLNVTNAASGAGSLGAQADACIAQNFVAPNFMLVDFYNYGEGSVFNVAASLNGVPVPTNTISPPIINGSSSQSTGAALGMKASWRMQWGMSGATVLLSMFLGACVFAL